MVFYRYENEWAPKSGCLDTSFCMADFEVKIVERRFESIKKTPKGHWIVPEYDYGVLDWQLQKVKRWVSISTTKRYAYPTKKGALYSLKKRKEMQKKHLTSQMTLVDATLKKLDGMNITSGK